MGFNFNGAKAIVTLSGSVTMSSVPLPADWDLILKSGTMGTQGTAVTDVIQVAAGKSLTIPIGGIVAEFTTNKGVSDGMVLLHTDSANAIIDTLVDLRNGNRSAGVGNQSMSYTNGFPIVLNNQEKLRAFGGKADSLTTVSAVGIET